jgi:DNA-binding FrmR family transcriptional regulator
MMDEKQKAEVIQRLNKIQGQLGGIQKMVTDERYCMDILTQTRACAAAIRKVEDLIMYQHLHTCVADSMKSGDAEDKSNKIAEIMDIFSKFRKTG